jgi:hypothetical protein
MSQFSVLQARVERRVIDLPASVLAEVPILINEAMHFLQQRHNFKVMETETAQTSTTADSHTLLAVPSDYKEARGLPYLVFNDGSTKDLLLAANRAAVLDALTLSDPNDVGEPVVILDAEPNDLGVRNFEVYPFPDGNSQFGDGEYRVVIPYWRYLPDLSAGTDTNWLTENAEEYLVFKATAEAFSVDWDEERSAAWEAKAGVKFNETIAADKRFRLGGVTTLVIHKDVNAPKLRR